MKGFAQIKCESKSKSFSQKLSGAGMRVSRIPSYISPEDAGPEHSFPWVLLSLQGMRSRRPMEAACPLSITHVQCHQEWYLEIHSLLAYSQRKTPIGQRMMNTTDYRQQEEATTQCWLPHVHPKHTSRKKEQICCLGFLSGHPGLRHRAGTAKQRGNCQIMSLRI